MMIDGKINPMALTITACPTGRRGELIENVNIFYPVRSEIYEFCP